MGQRVCRRRLRLLLVDWPGTGRSGSVPVEAVDFRFLVDGVAALIGEIGPVDLVGHSMGGFTSWKLRERLPELVPRVVGVAPAPPRELTPRSDIVADDGRVVRVRFRYTVEFEVDRTRPYAPSDHYVARQVIGASTRFPRATRRSYGRASWTSRRRSCSSA